MLASHTVNAELSLKKMDNGVLGRDCSVSLSEAQLLLFAVCRSNRRSRDSTGEGRALEAKRTSSEDHSHFSSTRAQRQIRICNTTAVVKMEKSA